MSQQAPKPPKKPSENKSNAKSLIGFLSGLVLATLIIIAVLLMINSNSKKDFKPTTEPVLTNDTPPSTETLTPNNTGTNSASPVQVAQNTQPETASDVLNKTNADNNMANNTDTNDALKTRTETTELPPVTPPTTAINTTPPQADADTRFNEPAFDDENNEPTFAPAPKPRETKPVRKEPQQTKQQPAQTAKTQKQPKPTPEQILDNGNIEKAREAAKREQAAQNSGSKKGGNVVLQAGSFNSRDYAESQRAKLAMLGVQAHISEAKVNGKTVYRVQTPKLNAERANDAKAVMRLNGVGVYERSAP